MLENPSDTRSIAADVVDALALIRQREVRSPTLALILGSGLGALADAVEDAVVFPTASLPGYPASTVAGHAGEVVIGNLEGQTVVFIRGRVHYYEGHPIRAVSFPVRLAHALGARRLLVTNAAGGINPGFEPGTLMLIHDHISYGWKNPLVGPNVDGGSRWPDMLHTYDPVWLDAAEREALSHRIATRRGVYLWTQGPSYETKAEVISFARMGADAVGMSTVPEVIQARYLGMPVLGISTITNYAAGLHHEALNHEDVLKVSAQVRAEMERLVRLVIRST